VEHGRISVAALNKEAKGTTLWVISLFQLNAPCFHWVKTEGKVKRKQDKIIKNSWQHWNTISLNLAALYYAPLFLKHFTSEIKQI
jgi:hypothetical protein